MKASTAAPLVLDAMPPDGRRRNMSRAVVASTVGILVCCAIGFVATVVLKDRSPKLEPMEAEGVRRPAMG